MKGSLQKDPREKRLDGERERAGWKTWQSLHQSEEKVGHMVGIKVEVIYI